LGDEPLDKRRKKLVKGRFTDLITGEASAAAPSAAAMAEDREEEEEGAVFGDGEVGEVGGHRKKKKKKKKNLRAIFAWLGNARSAHKTASASPRRRMSCHPVTIPDYKSLGEFSKFTHTLPRSRICRPGFVLIQEKSRTDRTFTVANITFAVTLSHLSITINLILVTNR
jgi:hypothetical protein